MNTCTYACHFKHLDVFEPLDLTNCNEFSREAVKTQYTTFQYCTSKTIQRYIVPLFEMARIALKTLRSLNSPV